MLDFWDLGIVLIPDGNEPIQAINTHTQTHTQTRKCEVSTHTRSSGQPHAVVHRERLGVNCTFLLLQKINHLVPAVNAVSQSQYVQYLDRQTCFNVS